jgi:hypothetical protein
LCSSPGANGSKYNTSHFIKVKYDKYGLYGFFISLWEDLKGDFLIKHHNPELYIFQIGYLFEAFI